jgi:hypothetical protein
MNCSEFETQLDGQLTASHLGESRDLAEHAAHCADCRALWERYRLLAESIVAWRDQTPEADLAAAVVSSPEFLVDGRVPVPARTTVVEASVAGPVVTHQAPTAARGRRASWLPAVAGLAALVFLAITIEMVRHHQPAALPVANDQRVRAIPPVSLLRNDLAAAPVPGANDDYDREMTPVAADLAPYSSLAQMATSALGQATVRILPGAAAAQPPASKTESTPADGWIDGLQDQLKPVGRSLGNAFDFLWQAGQSVDG